MDASVDAYAISLILTAAFLHAIWNAMVKGAGDRFISIGLVATGNALFGLVLALFFPAPAAESWPYIAMTIALHLAYFICLIKAYEFGDFSQMYPIARGTAPLIVALAAMPLAGEAFGTGAWAGILTISSGIIFLALSSGRNPARLKAVIAAVLTGFTIAAYTVVDGMGVRLSGSPAGYIGWSFALQISLGLGFLFIRRRALPALSHRQWLFGLSGGLISGLSFAIVIYTMSFTKLGAVSAIRESSVVIGALIGVVWFHERPWRPRLGAALLVAAGIVLLGVAG
jgi:drug/metabolite transporter (DMT)-like permease